jgi:hypothetical protein
MWPHGPYMRMQWSIRCENSIQLSSYGFMNMRPHGCHIILFTEDHNADLDGKIENKNIYFLWGSNLSLGALSQANNHLIIE